MQILNREKQLETLLTIAVGFFALYWATKNKYLFFAAMLLGLIGMFSKRLTKMVSEGWFRLGEAMGVVSSGILLTLAFFLILVPISFLQRISRKNLMLLNKTSELSYFTSRNHLYKPADLEKPW